MAKASGSLFRAKPAEKEITSVDIDVKKPKRGKHLISGLFEEPTQNKPLNNSNQ